ncbi:MAG TPA: hypothetical protein VFZ09_00115 [Archangium sp.]|uniref:hypothetical protein n=1 Tax=Archangium sp. TaxID=1872627 RepID=UPI002E3578AD|nr:hypothetical protein [Archangium sp.]HEX5744608.1 hypothetical protein [Archangium sp.]
MRKLMMAVMAVAGLGLTVGCQDRSKVQSEQKDVAEAQRDVAETRQESAQDLAEVRQDSQKEMSDAEKNLVEEQRELADAQHKQMVDGDDQATGGSGTTMNKNDTAANVKTEEVEGTIQSASANTIAIIVPDKNNQVMRFQADQQLKVMKDDKPVALKDLKAGDEVRASYSLDPNGKMMLKSIEVEKMSAQHPGVKNK